jgi:hypothetical protein
MEDITPKEAAAILRQLRDKYGLSQETYVWIAGREHWQQKWLTTIEHGIQYWEGHETMQPNTAGYVLALRLRALRDLLAKYPQVTGGV